MEKKKAKTKKLASADAALGEIEGSTIDPETFSFSTPKSNQTSTQNATAKSKLLALSLYVLNTTEEFKELSYRITKNTGQEESLVITHGGNLGLLGENLDPVTLTLTEKGTATINVLFRPPEKHLLLDKTLFDAGQFINILRRLTTKGQYSFCPGIGEVQPACFVKKLAHHEHPFSRYQSTECSVWYKNAEKNPDTTHDDLLVMCKPCKDLLKFIQTLPKKKTSDSPDKNEEEEAEDENSEATSKKRGRKKSRKSSIKKPDQKSVKDDLNSNTNNSCLKVEQSTAKVPEEDQADVESPKKPQKPDVPVTQSPRSSRRISAKGTSFCKVCKCFHNEKDSKTYPCQLTLQAVPSQSQEMGTEKSDVGHLSPSKNKEKSSKGRRKVKTPVKRPSTENKLDEVTEEEPQEREAVPPDENEGLLLEVTEIKTEEMEIGAEEELEFVMKDDIEDLQVQVVKEEVVEEEEDDSSSISKRKRPKRLKKKSNQDSDEGSDQDDIDAGASALLALTRGRKRDLAAGGASTTANETPSKKAGRPRVLGNQHSAPSGIEALLTAAMTADKDDKKGTKSKKTDNHLPTPRSKRDELNTPFKVLMAQIESDKAKGNEGSKPWKCPECGDFYSSKGNLRRHLRIHDLDRPHVCPICHKTFVQKITLKVHMRLHSGDKPHVCSVCNRAFAQKSNMETHLRRHLGQRPYKCHLCTKGFSDKGSLGEHIKTHTGEQPYVCPICKKAFSQRANMRTHMRRHKDDRPYVCSECNKMFKNKDGFWKHITAVHKASTPKADIPNLQDLEMFRKGLGEKEQDSSSDRGDDGEATDTDDGEATPAKKSKISVSVAEENKVDDPTPLPNGESSIKTITDDGKKVVTQYVHSTEPISVASTTSSTSTPTLDADLASQKKMLSKLSPKPVTTTSQNYYNVIVNALNSTVSPPTSANVLPTILTGAKPKTPPVAKTISFGTPIKAEPSLNIVASVPGPSQTVSKQTTSLAANVTTSTPVQALNMKPITLTSTPPVTSGYISVNLVGSDGKPIGVQYVNPKDLGLTISLQKSNATKFQVSSILSDNKSIVTSQIVTDPFTGKAVTFTPKSNTGTPTTKVTTTTPTPAPKRVPIGKKSPPPQGQENLASFIQALPVQPTAPVTKVNQSTNLTSIAPKAVYITGTTSASPGTKTVLLDMSPKIATGTVVSKSAFLTSPSTSEEPRIMNTSSNTKQSPKAVKTHLKSLVNATILRSVAEKCKASALSHQQSIVSSLLKPIEEKQVDSSNLVVVSQDQTSNVTTVIKPQVRASSAESQVIVTLSNADSEKESVVTPVITSDGKSLVTLSNVDATPSSDGVVILSNVDSQQTSNGHALVTLSNFNSQEASNTEHGEELTSTDLQDSVADSEGKPNPDENSVVTQGQELVEGLQEMESRVVTQESPTNSLQDQETHEQETVECLQETEVSFVAQESQSSEVVLHQQETVEIQGDYEQETINAHEVSAMVIDGEVSTMLIDGQEVSAMVIESQDVPTTVIDGHEVTSSIVDTQQVVDGHEVTTFVVEAANPENEMVVEDVSPETAMIVEKSS